MKSLACPKCGKVLYTEHAKHEQPGLPPVKAPKLPFKPSRSS